MHFSRLASLLLLSKTSVLPLVYVLISTCSSWYHVLSLIEGFFFPSSALKVKVQFLDHIMQFSLYLFHGAGIVSILIQIQISLLG